MWVFARGGLCGRGVESGQKSKRDPAMWDLAREGVCPSPECSGEVRDRFVFVSLMVGDYLLK